MPDIQALASQTLIGRYNLINILGEHTVSHACYTHTLSVQLQYYTQPGGKHYSFYILKYSP